MDLSFSEKCCLQQTDVLYLLAVTFFTFCGISPKYKIQEMMCSGSGVGKYITQFSLPQRYICISCIDLRSTRMLFIRTGKDLWCLLQYANFCGCWNISVISRRQFYCLGSDLVKQAVCCLESTRWWGQELKYVWVIGSQNLRTSFALGQWFKNGSIYLHHVFLNLHLMFPLTR